MSGTRSASGHRTGEWHQKAKLSDQDVESMRLKFIPYVYGYAKLAAEFKCGLSTARDIVTYRTR